MANILAKVLRIIQFIWLLPATILTWLFYILPLILLKEIEYVGMTDFLVFKFINPIDPKSWYDQQWEKWGGWSGPCVMIVKPYVGPGGHSADIIIEDHENQHCRDQFWFGPLFYPAYVLSCLWIWISNFWKKDEDKQHPYYANWFERRARKAAGQDLIIPMNKWIDGKDDYNPWI